MKMAVRNLVVDLDNKSGYSRTVQFQLWVVATGPFIAGSTPEEKIVNVVFPLPLLEMNLLLRIFICWYWRWLGQFRE